MRALVLALAAVVVAVAGCSGTSSGGGDDAAPRTVEIVVPAGTQARIDAGAELDIMPTRLELRVGDTLVIRNDDAVTQAVGPYTVKAGKEVELTYGSPGRFEGYCPLSAGQRYEIVVEE